ncbi:MAG: futalosine hydrolase [Chitinophagaceae bacterium]|nr:futalosine hydrolase [Chitinophagaceae bacterium]
MKVLLVSATEMEILPFLETKKEIDVLITGVGMPAAIYHLTHTLNHQQFDLVIQAGIAGTFDAGPKLAQVVVVERDLFADIGIEENAQFKTIFETGLANKNIFPFEDGWLVNPNDILKTSALDKVSAITINTISDRVKQIEMFNKLYHADIESMEGAALHYVCLHQKLAFLQLRSISNKVGIRDKSKWKIKEAVENLNHELKNLVELLYG